MKRMLSKAQSFNYDQNTISWEIHCMTAAEHIRLVANGVSILTDERIAGSCGSPEYS
jgi:hypothetical protein